MLNAVIVVVENHEGNFSEDSWATVVYSPIILCVYFSCFDMSNLCVLQSY